MLQELSLLGEPCATFVVDDAPTFRAWFPPNDVGLELRLLPTRPACNVVADHRFWVVARLYYWHVPWVAVVVVVVVVVVVAV